MFSYPEKTTEAGEASIRALDMILRIVVVAVCLACFAWMASIGLRPGPK
jgi:hypothetical protein